jgi:hypothetical protein
MPRTHASRHATRTTASSGPCDRRPDRDRVGDPRCCSRWGCNRGRERKPDMQAVVGAGCYPSLLPAISDRQLPFDGVMRMPREDLPTGRQAARVHWRRDLRARRARRCVDRSRPVGNVPAAGPDAPAHCPSSGASVWASDSSGVEASDSPAWWSRSANSTRTARLHSPSRSRSRPGRSCCSSRLASLQRRRRSPYSRGWCR